MPEDGKEGQGPARPVLVRRLSKCQCASEVGDLMAQCGVHIPMSSAPSQPALAEVCYDGSAMGFGIALGGIGSFRKVREYGLAHMLPTVLRAMPDLFECMGFAERAQVLL
eukprot:CAMPEP_0173258110 /NCGR_PEP_ID=MMETSP1142-20121109/24185_1 /TAXON_ID=483371 /ORGANISM="non described non described, Strain CCMP2298" /LENGTH=109 /DNA_ID=CAMNT_0014192397 /DNA_START=134 /DNA_END=460 /DNA_ORIENTATION=-